MSYSTCNFATEIDENECIGDSLETINTNFSAVEVSLCNTIQELNNLKATVGSLLGGIQTLMNIRMSLSPTQPITTTDITSTTLYIHPYNGDAITLWNPSINSWEVKQFPTTLSFNLALVGAQTPNRNYDIYLYWDTPSLTYKIECIPWTDQTLGVLPPQLGVQDGILVKPGESNKRLIGCVRTTESTSPLGQTTVSFGKTAAFGGSYPKLFLWNLYNQQPASFSILETGVDVGGLNAWESTLNGDNAGGVGPAGNGPFEPFGNVIPSTGQYGNKVEFITRQPIIAALQSIHYTGRNVCFYFGYSLDIQTPTAQQIFQKTPGIPIYESCRNGDLSQSFYSTINPGHHYIQLISMTYANQTQQYLTWTGDRHSYGTIGTISAF